MMNSVIPQYSRLYRVIGVGYKYMMANYSDNSVDISKYLQDESHISKKNSQKYTGEFIIKAKPVNQKIYRKSNNLLFI